MASAKSNPEIRLGREVREMVRRSRLGVYRPHAVKDLTYAEFLSDKMLLIAAIRSGIPYTFFEQVRAYAPFDERNWTEYLGISAKTLLRYKAQAAYRFKPLQSEKIIEIAEVVQAGMEVFGDMDKLKLWLETPNYALGKLPPAELLKDSYGKEMVLRELVHIEHGLLA